MIMKSATKYALSNQLHMGFRKESIGCVCSCSNKQWLGLSLL